MQATGSRPGQGHNPRCQDGPQARSEEATSAAPARLRPRDDDRTWPAPTQVGADADRMRTQRALPAGAQSTASQIQAACLVSCLARTDGNH